MGIASRGYWGRVRGPLFALAAATAIPPSAEAQTVRNHNVQFTATAPTIDGVVSAGEWNAAAAAAGSWQELRQPETDMDTENNRFRMMWDAANLYVLYETDFNDYFQPLDKVGVPNPQINFSDDNLNLYFDPNTDGGPNFTTVPDANVSGYQLAFNQYSDPDGGALISTDENRQGVGFFTEAHAGTNFGDQANWNRGGSQTAGAALQDIVIAQKNGATGGVAELRIPWSNFNADALAPPPTTESADFDSDGLVDGEDFLIWQRGLGLIDQTNKAAGDADSDTVVGESDLEVWKGVAGSDTRIVTGLTATSAPANGAVWFFQMGRISHLANDNFLPVWNWQPGQFYSERPHGTLTFQGGPAAAAVPEPTALLLVAAGGLAVAPLRRRTRSGR